MVALMTLLAGWRISRGTRGRPSPIISPQRPRRGKQPPHHLPPAGAERRASTRAAAQGFVALRDGHLGTYVYEIRIPFAELWVEPDVGVKLGLSIRLNDSDGRGFGIVTLVGR